MRAEITPFWTIEQVAGSCRTPTVFQVTSQTDTNGQAALSGVPPRIYHDLRSRNERRARFALMLAAQRDERVARAMRSRPAGGDSTLRTRSALIQS
jgi:hypothetical protein